MWNYSGNEPGEYHVTARGLGRARAPATWVELSWVYDCPSSSQGGRRVWLPANGTISSINARRRPRGDVARPPRHVRVVRCTRSRSVSHCVLLRGRHFYANCFFWNCATRFPFTARRTPVCSNCGRKPCFWSSIIIFFNLIWPVTQNRSPMLGRYPPPLSIPSNHARTTYFAEVCIYFACAPN